MNKHIILGAIVAMGLATVSCDDFLNDNRSPISDQVNNNSFWENTANVDNQINYFYQDYLGYGNGTGTGAFYFTTLNDDQCGRNNFTNWKNVNVPTSSTNWTSPYTEIRRAFLIIEGLNNPEQKRIYGAERDNYLGMCYLHIARQYYSLVRTYGDVPLLKNSIDLFNPEQVAEMYLPRVSRDVVMDYALECINFAIENIAAQSAKTTLSKDLAQAIKTEICLYEGSYNKYHTGNMSRANQFFQYAVAAGEAIAARYPIGDDYTATYKSLRVAGNGYNGLTNNSEIIFFKPYEKGVFMHSIMDYSCASDGIAGLTKDAFDSYLFLDGKPKALTTYNNTDQGVPNATEKSLSIANLLQVRDQRLAMTTYDHVFFSGMSWTGPNTSAMWSKSGYGVSKYDNFQTSTSDATQANKGYTSAPLYWGARLYLAIAEAKAELGTLTDADVTTYIAPLWKRAGIEVAPTLAFLSGMNDPDNDMGVSSLLWEIRRCRRCELIMDDDIRYWDLVRWHQLDKLDTTKNPDIALGAYVANAPIQCQEVTGNYANCTYGNSRTFEEKQYLFPIPSGQLTLNENLTQNPGW